MSECIQSPSVSSKPEAFEKLGVVEKVGYGLGDLGSGLLFTTFNMFLLFFYTDVVGLSASAIFWIFLVAKFWDMINDPIMGAIVDRTKTRWGTYRPYILGLAIPYGLSAYLMFTVPDLSDSGKAIYCGATYVLATMMYTGVNIPYCALMGVITPNVIERTKVSQYRFFLSFLGGWLINTFTLPLARLFGSDTSSETYNAEAGYDPVIGYSTTMLVFGILAVLLFVTTFVTTKERVVSAVRKSNPFRQDLGDLVRNSAWWILFITAILNRSHMAMRNGVTLYYLNYYVSDSQRTLFAVPFGFFDLEVTRVVLFMSAGALAAVVGVPFTQTLVKWLGKRCVFMTILLITGGLEGATYFAVGTDYWVVLTAHLLANLFGGIGAAVIFAMYADAADYSEWKTSRRAMGLIVATILFAIKGGIWVGGQVLAGVLMLIGYSTETARDPEIQQWIRSLFTWMPATLAILAGLLMLKYPLTDDFMKKIESDLMARKSERST